MIKIDLSHDHGKDHTPAERDLIGKMLENAYRLGYEAGATTARRMPLYPELKEKIPVLSTRFSRRR